MQKKTQVHFRVRWFFLLLKRKEKRRRKEKEDIIHRGVRLQKEEKDMGGGGLVGEH